LILVKRHVSAYLEAIFRFTNAGSYNHTVPTLVSVRDTSNMCAKGTNIHMCVKPDVIFDL
jgi:hypothetical protein